MINFLKRHRLFIGNTLLIISLISFCYLFTQTKININIVPKQQLSEMLNNIDGVSDKSIEKIQSALPIKNIQDIEELDGIGEVKYNKIETIFCTYDTLRLNIFILLMILTIILNIIGTSVIIKKIIKSSILSEKAKGLIDKIK